MEFRILGPLEMLADGRALHASSVSSTANRPLPLTLQSGKGRHMHLTQRITPAALAASMSVPSPTTNPA